MIENIDLVHPQIKEAQAKYCLQLKVMACDPQKADTAEFCAYYQIDPGQTCNAIVAASKSNPPKYACCVILSTCKLDVNKTVCRMLDVKKCSFAGADETKARTGMEIGGVSPIGVSGMPVLVDARVMELSNVVLGGGNRTSKILIDPCELRKLPEMQIVDGLGIIR